MKSEWLKEIEKFENPEHIGVFEPPCVNCYYWYPKILYMDIKERPLFDGLRLCHSKEMLCDFSCFKNRV